MYEFSHCLPPIRQFTLVSLHIMLVHCSPNPRRFDIKVIIGFIRASIKKDHPITTLILKTKNLLIILFYFIIIH